MKKLIGFLAQKIGFSCGSSNSRSFIDGWFLGSGITVKTWTWESPAFGRYEWKVSLVLHTRKDFKFGFSIVEYDCRKSINEQRRSKIGRVFAFGYGAIVISNY